MITDTAVRKKGVAPVPVLAINSPFTRYGPENERVVRETDVKQDKAVEEMKELYRKTKSINRPNRNALLLPGHNPDDYVISWYNHAADSLKKCHYSAAEIERFSIALTAFQDEITFPEKAGLFLSVLINNCKNKDCVVHTAHLAVSIDYLGYKNTKNITVEGNAGLYVGNEMKRGTITVKGNAGNLTGNRMRGGTILVKGNTGESVGLGMRCGNIFVDGNAGHSVGAWAKGGKIHIEGRIEGNVNIGPRCHLQNHESGKKFILGEYARGTVFHKGMLILDKGKP